MASSRWWGECPPAVYAAPPSRPTRADSLAGFENVFYGRGRRHGSPRRPLLMRQHSAGLTFDRRTFLLAAALPAARNADPALVIQQVSVFDTASGTMKPGRTIVVSGEKITAVGTPEQPAA